MKSKKEIATLNYGLFQLILEQQRTILLLEGTIQRLEDEILNPMKGVVVSEHKREKQIRKKTDRRKKSDRRNSDD